MSQTFCESLEARRMLSAGAIDHSFGVGGIVNGSVALPARTNLVSLNAMDVAVGANGKKWVVGQINDSQTFVARFNRDGSRDTPFGQFGVMTFLAAHGKFLPAKIAVDPNGRAVVAGRFQSEDGKHFSFFLARVTVRGSLDHTFGTGGMVATSFADGSSAAVDVAFASGGRIVAAGYVDTTSRGETMAVARYTVGGNLDTSFGAGGTLTIDADHFDESVSVVTLDSQGRMLLGGFLMGRHTAGKAFAVVRLTRAGNLDRSFDGNGIAAVDLAGDEDVTSLLITKSGQYVIGGTTLDTDFEGTFAAAARLNSDGSLDTAFAEHGTLLLLDHRFHSGDPVLIRAANNGAYQIFYDGGGFGESRISAAGILDRSFGVDGFDDMTADDDTEVLAGAAFSGNGIVLLVNISKNDPFPGVENVFALERFNGGGKPDTTFVSEPAFPVLLNSFLAFGDRIDSPLAAAVTIDGDLIVAGKSQLGDLFYRFNADSKLDPTFADGGRLEEVNDSGLVVFTPTLLPLPDGGFLTWSPGQEDDQDGIAIVDEIINRKGQVAPPTTLGGGFTLGTDMADDETGYARVQVLPGGWIEEEYDNLLTDIDHASLSNRNSRSVFELSADTFLPNGVAIDFARVDRMVPVGSGGTSVVVSGSGEYFKSDGDPVDVGFVARLNRDGSFDRSFGRNGILQKSISLLAAQTDGKILYFNPSGSGLKRLNNAGHPDNSFGIAGVAAAGYEHFTVDGCNRIIAWKLRKDGDVQAARFTRNGKVDTAFGVDGVRVVHLPVKGDVNLLITPSNDLVITAFAQTESTAKWSAIRIFGD